MATSAISITFLTFKILTISYFLRPFFACFINNLYLCARILSTSMLEVENFLSFTGFRTVKRGQEKANKKRYSQY